MNSNIPLTFTYKDKQYNATLSPVSGASKTLYHLMIDGYYKGQLFQTGDTWRFTSQTGEFEELTDLFVKAVTAEI